MNNSLKIKVCGLRDPNNIQEVAKLSPDFMGLIFYTKSPRFVNDKDADKILTSIPDDVEKVAVFVNEISSEIIRLSNLFRFSHVQLHGSETPLFCKELKDVGFTVIKGFGVNTGFDFQQLLPYSESCDYFLFDTKSDKHGGTGKKFNWQILEQYTLDKPFFLSGGIDPEDAVAIAKLNTENLFAVDINSRFETEPGLKDTKKLELFFSTLRNVEA